MNAEAWLLRLFVLGLALFTFSGDLSSAIHPLLVEHVRCPYDGALEHAAGREHEQLQDRSGPCL